MIHTPHEFRPRPRPWSDVRLARCGRAVAASLKKYARTRTTASRQHGGLCGWGAHYLAEHFRLTPSAMHRWLQAELHGMESLRGVYLNVIGPRGSAKSTVCTLAYPLWSALEERESYIWILSDTRDQACLHLQNIKSELVSNSLLRHDYAQAVGVGPVWREHLVRMNNGVVLEAFGTGQRIRGRRHRSKRPTLIICDDLQNDQHISSEDQRHKTRQWFHGTVLRAGTNRTNVIHVATALHPDALAMELDRAPGWRSQRFRALDPLPVNLHLWQQWEALYCDRQNPDRDQTARSFYEARRAEMDLGAGLLWREEDDLYSLMKIRVDSGQTAFDREKQSTPASLEHCEWPDAYFDDSIWFDDWPTDPLIKTMSLDPSKGRDARTGDYSAYVLVAVDAQGVIHVEADLERRPISRMVTDGVRLIRQFQPDAFGIESNQFQELLAGEFEAEYRRQGLLVSPPWLLDNHVSKQVRIRRLSPYLSGRKILFKRGSPSTERLVKQLREFPLGSHDDGPDALEMAIRLAAERLQELRAGA